MIADRIIVWSLAFALAFFPALASAQSPQIIQTVIMGAGKGVPGGAVTFALTFAASKSDTVGGTTITYNGGGDPSIGTADPNRVVAIAIMCRVGATATVTSATIGGVSATQASGAGIGIAGASLTDIWYASVPSGTTAAVAVTYGSASVVSEIAVYRIITSTPTPQDSQHNSTATLAAAGNLSKSVTIPGAGGAIGAFGYVPGSSSLPDTWSGGTITRDVDVSLTGGRNFSASNDVTDSGLITFAVSPASGASAAATLSLAAWK